MGPQQGHAIQDQAELALGRQKIIRYAFGHGGGYFFAAFSALLELTALIASLLHLSFTLEYIPTILPPHPYILQWEETNRECMKKLAGDYSK